MATFFAALAPELKASAATGIACGLARLLREAFAWISGGG